eukprot:scaffold53253_cov65-Phaeocystis_antarctica.AAC.11
MARVTRHNFGRSRCIPGAESTGRESRRGLTPHGGARGRGPVSGARRPRAGGYRLSRPYPG